VVRGVGGPPAPARTVDPGRFAEPGPESGGRGQAELPADGRTARAVRTRAAIVDALLDLLHAGDLQPTANRIADQAGISLRLIYHHFGDLESLFRAASAREAERLAVHVDDIDPALPVAERIDRIVAQRREVLELITPVRLASLAQEPFSEELRAARDALIVIGRQQVLDLFAAELDAVDPAVRPALEAALTTALAWGFWNDLRTAGYTMTDAELAMRHTVDALLRPA